MSSVFSSAAVVCTASLVPALICSDASPRINLQLQGFSNTECPAEGRTGHSLTPTIESRTLDVPSVSERSGWGAGWSPGTFVVWHATW